MAEPSLLKVYGAAPKLFSLTVVALGLFLALGGGALLLGGALGFVLATSLLRFYILFIGGGIVLCVVLVGVLAATTEPCVHCEDAGLGLLIALALNVLGWLFGLTLGGFFALLLRTADPGSEPQG